MKLCRIIAENISVKVSRVIGSSSLSLQIFSSAIQSVTCSQKLIEVNMSASNISQLSVSNCEAETENKILRFAIFLRNSQNWRLENIRKFYEINESFLRTEILSVDLQGGPKRKSLPNCVVLSPP